MNTKKHIAERLVADYPELQKGKAQQYVDSMIESMTKLAESGEPLYLHGFGTFRTKLYHAREGFNKMAGKVITYAARRTVVFKPTNRNVGV